MENNNKRYRLRYRKTNRIIERTIVKDVYSGFQIEMKPSKLIAVTSFVELPYQAFWTNGSNIVIRNNSYALKDVPKINFLDPFDNTIRNYVLSKAYDTSASIRNPRFFLLNQEKNRYVQVLKKERVNTFYNLLKNEP